MTRAPLHGVLERNIRELGVGVHVGSSVEELSQHERGVDARLTTGIERTYDLVLGADGLHSAVRAMVLPDAPGPTPAGQIVWRARVPRPAGVDGYTIMVGAETRLGLVPVSDDTLYVWMLDNSASAERPSPSGLIELFREKVSPYGGHAPEVLAAVEGNGDVDYRALQFLLVPPPWHAGRVVLLGDAVHASTPHLGYGLGLGLEDCAVLAEIVRAGVGAEKIGELFTARRFDRARMVVENALALCRAEGGAPLGDRDPLSVVTATYAELVKPF